MENKDIIIAGIFLPLLALISVSLMVVFSNYLQQGFLLDKDPANPLIIGIIYAIAFIMPYLVKSLILLKQGEKDILRKL